MRNIILVILFLILQSPCAIAQTTISYAYDSAGNRVKRAILVSKSIPRENVDRLEVFSESLSGIDINICYNQASDIIKVEVPTISGTNDAVISIYSVTGQLLSTKNPITTVEELDISCLTTGIYVLNIQLNGSSTSWKILKE